MVSLGVENPVPSDGGWICTVALRDDLQLQPSSVLRELLDGTGPVRVSGSAHDRQPALLQVAPEFRDRRGLARAVYAEEEYDVRFPTALRLVFDVRHQINRTSLGKGALESRSEPLPNYF